MDPERNASGDRSTRETTTRYATIVIDPGSDGFYPESQRLVEDADVTRERVHHVSALEDGTIVGLYELHGDSDRIRAGLEGLTHVVSYDVTGTDPVFVYLHEEATEPARTLLSHLETSRVVLDHPLEYLLDGALRLTVIGEAEPLRRTLGSIDDLVEVRLEETGEYRPEMRDLASLLTGRQRQILHLAVERGYYEIPRRVTHKELAEHAELSQSTIAEHLQKIEASILPRVVRE